MKKINLMFLSLVFIILSCNSSDENNSNKMEQSLATRIYLNAVKQSTSPSNFNSSTPTTLCFMPVFPIGVNYTNGVSIAINSVEGLKEAIFSENSGFHISTIIYPFTITQSQNNEVFTVHNEDQFRDLLFGCDTIKSIDEYFTSATCFEFLYPLSVINNEGEKVSISNSENLLSILNTLSDNEFWVDFVYPFKIKYGARDVLIRDIWGFYNYVDCTPDFGCICTAEFNPVCVETPNGVLQFGNSCWATCAGYTSEDFVSCD